MATEPSFFTVNKEQFPNSINDIREVVRTTGNKLISEKTTNGYN